MSDQPRVPQLEHVFGLAIDLALRNARNSLPGRVVSYDEDRQAAVVQPLIKEPHISEDQERVIEPLPEIRDVPVTMFGGVGGRVTVPVNVGDVGMIQFASRSIMIWKLTGGLVDPDDDANVHDINDCVFYPGGHDLAHPPTSAPTDAIVTHGLTKIGGPTGTEKTYRADTHMAAADALQAATNTMIAAIVGYTVAVGALGGVFSPTVPLASALTTALTTFASAVAAYVGGEATYKTTKAEVL